MMSLTYVSRVSIDVCDQTRELGNILAVAMARNSMLNITGLLIASPQHFAQLLEGPVDAIEAVMTSIIADSRNNGLRIVETAPIKTTSYSRWQMVRLIEGDFGRSILDPILEMAHSGDDAHAVSHLKRLIKAIA